MTAAFSAAGPAGLAGFAWFAAIGIVPDVNAQTVTGHLAVLSDYVDRGLSLSGEDLAGQGQIFADADFGLYGGLFVSSVQDGRGNDVEVEAILGYGRQFGAYDLDVSLSADSFHGADSFVFPEIAARLSRDLGLAYLAAGIAYAPDGRWRVRNEQTLYSYGELEIPVPRLPWLAATAHVGWTAIADSPDRLDWGTGLVAGWRRFELSLAYEDSDAGGGIAGARAVAALRIYF